MYDVRQFRCLFDYASKIKELSHDNILPFIGACVDPGEILYATQFCSRGTVQASKRMYLFVAKLSHYRLKYCFQR